MIRSTISPPWLGGGGASELGLGLVLGWVSGWVLVLVLVLVLGWE